MQGGCGETGCTVFLLASSILRLAGPDCEPETGTVLLDSESWKLGGRHCVARQHLLPPCAAATVLRMHYAEEVVAQSSSEIIKALFY